MRNAMENARLAHNGVFVTRPGNVEICNDRLPKNWFENDYVITESIGNSLCSSDQKAISQFTNHTRIPNSADRIALGHETIQKVVYAPNDGKVKAGQIVVVNPGLSNTPVDPETFMPDPDNGILASFGYSFRYAAGLRRYSGISAVARKAASAQGLGDVFIPIPDSIVKLKDISIATLTHAEPFACCLGALRQTLTRNNDGKLTSGIEPNSSVAMLSGTGRMAAITLGILLQNQNLPRRITITGSQIRLRWLAETPVFKALQKQGVKPELVDRNSRVELTKLCSGEKFDIVITYYASQESYDIAANIVRIGGNVNNFAGASDSKVSLPMTIPATKRNVKHVIKEMIHPDVNILKVPKNGLAAPANIALAGFSPTDPALHELLKSFPAGTKIFGTAADDRFPKLVFKASPPFTDLFIAGSGTNAAKCYHDLEKKLARGAAVNFIDGETQININSRNIHYLSRHQICGMGVPYFLTNTSEPESTGLVEHVNDPINFDWMVQHVSGLNFAPRMIREVGKQKLFGSSLVLNQLEELPFVEVKEKSFRAAAKKEREKGHKHVAASLDEGADVLATSNNQWSRAVENALYNSFGLSHPLSYLDF